MAKPSKPSHYLSIIKKHYQTILEWFFLVGTYLYSLLPMRDFDIWFHLKAGELLVAQKSLPLIEKFSFVAEGKAWYPHEWLFEVFTYLVSKNFGITILPWLTNLAVILTLWSFLRLLENIFKLNFWLRLPLAFILFVSTLEFNTVRPHVLAYAFVALTLYLGYANIYLNKKWIYWLPLVTLFWANWHSSAFLSWGLLLSLWVLKPNKDLFAVLVLNFFATLLPPLGTQSYKMLYEFYSDRKFLSTFISEWSPLGDNPAGMAIYSLWVGLTGIILLIQTIIKKDWWQKRFLLPLLLMVFMGYTASRNQVMGNLALFLLLGTSTQNIFNLSSSRRTGTCLPADRSIKLLLFILFLTITTFYIYLAIGKKQNIKNDRLHYPVAASEFAKRYLTGRMYNDYTYGGYILYNVYPNLQVLVDGRAELYHLDLLRDYQRFAIFKYSPDDEYKKVLNEFWDKYQIDFVIIPVRKHNVSRRISSLLNSDPNWALVFWDDDNQIFVRKNGKNQKVIDGLESTSATPYLKTLFKTGEEENAAAEYQRMEQVTPSARNANALGYILLTQKKYQQAEILFDSAIIKDPTFESPYMNKAELKAKDGLLNEAIDLYTKAQHNAPDRGLIYIRLGQLMQKRGDPLYKIKTIWESGLKNTADDEAKKTLQNLLSELE